jgi:hypothetical protein
MADISGTPGRVTGQRRTTLNRSDVGVRRDTDLSALKVSADLRSASRGDGGAGELERTLNKFMDAGAGAYDAQTQANKPRYAAERAEGQMAAATGAEPTPEQLRSRSFTGALYGARALSQHNTFAADLEQKVSAAVEGGADDVEIHDLIMGNMTAHRDNFLENNPDPAALAAEGGRMVTLGDRLSTAAVTRIRTLGKEELITTQGGNLMVELDAWPPEVLAAPEQPIDADPALFTPTGDLTAEGPPVDVYANAATPPLPVERWVAERIAGGFTGQEAKAQVIQTVVNAATNRDNPRPELIEQMLESTQADGRTPSFNPTEVASLQNSLSQARNLEEGVAKDRHDDARDSATVDLFTRALAGEDVTEAVITLGQQGIYDPQETSGALGLLRGLSTVREEGRVNAAYVAEVQRRIASGNPMSNSAILEAERQGRFGTGLAAKRAATQALISPAALSEGSAGRQVMPSGMTRNEERSYAWDQVQEAMFQPSPDQPLNAYEARANALIGSYFNSLQDGRLGRMNPTEALAATRVEMGRRQENHARIYAPPRSLPPGRAAVPPGTYRWGGDGAAQ